MMSELKKKATIPDGANNNTADVASHLEHAHTHGTYLQKDEAANLTAEHRQYLLDKHGTLELDPVPSINDADPYNWPRWKKITNLVLVAIHACMATFMAAGIIPAFENIAQDLNVSLVQASYLTSMQIVVTGVIPLFWRPLSTRYGRRPIFLISLIGSACFNIGCARTQTYGSQATCRVFAAAFICPAASLGSAVVAETFFKHERAKMMGIWTIMVTVGIPLSPFIFGFVTYHAGYRWIYWIFAMINGAQFLAYIFFGPETRFLRSQNKMPPPNEAPIKTSYFSFRRVDPTPFTAYEFVSPLRLAIYPCVAIPAVAYSMVFLFASVLITVEVPQLFGEKFHLNAQQLGLQFLALIIGSIIGEQIGGRASDHWMRRRARKLPAGTRPEPEFRLWLGYFGYALTICGLVVFLVRTSQAREGHWNVTPIVGAGIAAAGNQILTTVLITYAVDCYTAEAGSIGVFISLVRQTWGFIGPFWFPPMFEHVGVLKSTGVVIGMIVGLSLLPVILLQWIGKRIRKVEMIARI